MTKDIYGVLGYPVKHSLSPAMHNAAFRALKVNAEYLKFEKSPEEIPGFLHSLADSGIKGLNVTVPHKEKVMQYIDDCEKVAQGIGAVNTIVVEKDGELKGYNTDYKGFFQHIDQLKVLPRSVAIIGAGGASRAVCFALGLHMVGNLEVRIYDIDCRKSNTLAEEMQKYFAKCRFTDVTSINDLKIDKSDLLINASPIGMKQSDPCLVNESFLHQDLFVYDLIYNPAETRLLKTAKEKGCRFSNGLGMLWCQGVASLEIWRKSPLSKEIKEVMWEALVNSA